LALRWVRGTTNLRQFLTPECFDTVLPAVYGSSLAVAILACGVLRLLTIAVGTKVASPPAQIWTMGSPHLLRAMHPTDIQVALDYQVWRQ
jgi:hypothetical protein